MVRQHANRLIQAAEVVATLAPIGAIPATESQARAIRRAGELYGQIQKGKPGPKTELEDGTVPQLSRTEAAKNAGMSERQRKTALRVANVPEPVFERAVESHCTSRLEFEP
jgi:hypothetical protein